MTLSAAPPPVSFNAPFAYFPGDPKAIAVGDFNGDGISDLAIADYSYYSGSVAVMLGNPDGTLQPAVNYTTAAGTAAVAVADFNGDGKLDIAVADFSGVSLLLGNGDGTFQPAGPLFPISYFSPTYMAVGDFNNDGKKDVAIISAESNTLYVILGDGEGGFLSQVTYTTGTYPLELAVSDLNGDGNQDLVIAAYGYNGANGSISVLMGNGDGTFYAGATYNPSMGPGSIAIADFNEDGIPDLAVVISASVPRMFATVGIMLGNGDGTFMPPLGYRAGESPYWVAVGDFNRDGHLDLAVANYSSANTTILLGFGNGTFDRERSYSPGGGFVTVGSFNRHATQDLVVLAGTEMAILHGDGKGDFQGVKNDAVGKSPEQVTVGAFTADSSLDLVVANYNSNTVSFLQGNGNGTFRPQVTYQTGAFPYTIANGDFNSDGKLDIVLAGTDIEVLLGNGDGTFQPVVSIPAPLLNNPHLVVADFNGDGKADLAVTSSSYTSSTISILLGNGNATFQPPVTYTIGNGAGNLVVGDFNSDGKPDIAVVTGMSITVLLGNGDGTFKATVTPFVDTIGYIAAGDFNDDTKLDLVVSVTFPVAETWMLLGNGDGTFLAPVSYPSIGGALVTADFNGDGKLDLASSAVSVMLGNGDGTLEAPVNFAIGSPGNSGLAVGNFKQLGKPDLAVPNINSEIVSILLNTTR